MAELPPGLVAWARMPGPAAVLGAVRARAERGFRTEAGTLRLELAPSQRREVARLLGTPWDVSGKPVRLEDLTAALAEHGLTVRAFVEAVDGRRLVDRRRERDAERAAAAAERSAAASTLIASGLPRECVDTWLADAGLPRPGSGALAALAEQVATVWRRLPQPGDPPVRLARLAAASRDDAHALDYSELLGRAVSRLVALVHGLPRPRSAGRDWRRAWLAAGVRCDAVSSRVLVLNLPLEGGSPAARLCTATPGEPVWLSLRALDGDWAVPAATQVFVCENPTVVEAAADALGAGSPAVVCTDGNASMAALDLLAGLSASGAAFSVRADVDPAGLVIVQRVLEVVERAVLWRYDAATYAAHLDLPAEGMAAEATAAAGQDPRAGLERLRALHARHRTALHEEALLDDLVRDLALSAPNTNTNATTDAVQKMQAADAAQGAAERCG